MRRMVVAVLLSGFCQAVIVASALASTAAVPAGLSKAQQRCSVLDSQFHAALKSHPGMETKRAEADADKGESLCASGKPALGLRYYVKALNHLGLQPNLPKQ